MTKLYTLNIGDTVNQKLWIDELSQELDKLDGMPPFLMTDENVDLDKYVDITSISNIEKYGPLINNNHFKIKEALSQQYDNNWDYLSENDKIILSKYFIVDKEKVLEVLNNKEFDYYNHYKIYNYLNDDILDNLNEDSFNLTPKSIDYKKSVNTRLHPDMTFDRFGFLTEVIYYSELTVDTSGPIAVYNFNNPIIKYNAIYNTGPDGYTISRETIRQWTLNCGKWSDNKKISLKIYDPISSRNEAKRRRRNLINNLLVEIIGLIMMTTPELQTTQLAETDAMGFMHDIEGAITAYYESGTTPDADGNPCKLIEIILTNNYVRLNNYVPGTNNTLTIRNYLLSRINPK